MKILTSNSEKIREIKSLYPHLEVVQGPDLREVMGTADEVIIYKALEAGPGFVVEDTILEIDGEEVVDIRWKLGDLKEGAVLKWIVSFGYYKPTDPPQMDGSSEEVAHAQIRVYRGSVDGTITIPTSIPEGAFGFDCYFKPIADPEGRTLHRLQQDGQKDKYSPRALALEALVKDQPLFTREVCDIDPWTGAYQVPS